MKAPPPLATASPTGRTVFVTGGTRGIGLEVCRALLRDGYDVICVARTTTDDYEELRSQDEGRATFLAADLAAREGLNAVARAIRTQPDMYGLVNNAGVAISGLLTGLPRDAMEQMLSLNLMAPMVLSQAAIKAMIQAQTGRIVTIGSVCAQRPYRGLSAYAATKAALEGFTRVLAAEAGAWGITANCVAPGFVDTAMTAVLDDAKREHVRGRSMLPTGATPIDIAEAVAFLMSPAAGSVTAEVIRVDGGSAA